MGAPQSPCRDCQRRQVGCHGSCREYLAFREEWEKFRQWERANKPKEKSAWMKRWIRERELYGKRHRR